MIVLRFFRSRVVGYRRDLEQIDEIKKLQTVQKLLGKKGIEENRLLLDVFTDDSSNVRYLAAKYLAENLILFPEIQDFFVSELKAMLTEGSITQKLAAILVFRLLKLEDITPTLLAIVKTSSYDLQFAAIESLRLYSTPEVLEGLEVGIDVDDYVTRRAALISSYNIIRALPQDQWLTVLTPHLHLLIKIYLLYEDVKDVLTYILDRADPNHLPDPRGYSEYQLKHIRKLLESVEYSRYIYENLWSISFPLYHAEEEV